MREAHEITTEDPYRSQLSLAAAYGQLRRKAEADEAMGKLAALRREFPDGVREDLRRRYGYPEALTERLMDGLRKAGLSG